MFYFGKVKNTEDWGFNIEGEIFDNPKEITDEEREDLMRRAREGGKWITGDKNGNPILVDPPPPSEEEQKQQRLNELLSYLEETDWYAIRFADTGEPIPEEIKKKRAKAREEISNLRNEI